MSFVVSRAELDAYAEAHTTPPAELLGRAGRGDEGDARVPADAHRPGRGPLPRRLLVFATGATAGARDRHLQRLLGAVDGGRARRRAATSTRASSTRSTPTVASRYIARSPYADRITVHVGPAIETIARLDGPFDLVFVDADKPGYDAYYEAVLPKLAPSGLIVFDNMLQNGRVVEEPDAGEATPARSWR